MSPLANAKYSMLASVFQIFYLTFCILYLKVKSMSSKTAPLYPNQLHLRLECLCFLSCFYILFCFSSPTDQYLPIWRSKTFSLFCSPCCWFWLKGIGWAWGKESWSLYLTTKIIPFPWHVQQLQREFDIWGDWVARVILIYRAIGIAGIGAASELQGWEWVRDLGEGS